MPLQNSSKFYLNFSAGLFTEANPMVFPENTCKDIDNVDLQRQGYVQRRLGLEFETSHAKTQDSWTENQITTYAITSHEWRSVNGSGNLNFLVVQVGGMLYFYNLGADVISLSPLGKMNFSTIRTSEDYYLYPIDSTSGKGRLFIVGRKISPFYIEYDEEANTFTGYKITVKIRDIDGIEEEDDDIPLITDAVTPDETAYLDQINQDILDAIGSVNLSQIYHGFL